MIFFQHYEYIGDFAKSEQKSVNLQCSVELQ